MSDKKDSVVSLAERREVPHDPDAIARLEECLKLAKEDGVDSFAIAMVCNAGLLDRDWETTLSFLSLI